MLLRVWETFAGKEIEYGIEQQGNILCDLRQDDWPKHYEHVKPIVIDEKNPTKKRPEDDIPSTKRCIRDTT
jgi:hypothetical protein